MALSKGLQSPLDFWMKTFSQYLNNASSECFSWSPLITNWAPKLGLFLNICWTLAYCCLRSSIFFALFDWWFVALTNSRVLNSTFFSSLNSRFCLTSSRVFPFDDILSEIHLWYSMLMMDLLNSLSSLGSTSDMNSSSVNQSRNLLPSMNCSRPTNFSESILAQLVVALKSAFMSDAIIFESSLQYCGLFLILIMISTSRVGNCCWREMLILFLCNPPRFNSAVASAFHDSVSSRFGRWWILSSAGHESWHEMSAGIDVSVSVVIVEEVRYLSSIALYLSVSLWLLMAFNVLCLNLLWFFIDIVYSIWNHFSLHGSKHAIFFLCPSCFWRGKTSSGFVIFNWMDSVFMDMFTSHSGELLVAKVTTHLFSASTWRSFVLSLNQFASATVYKLHATWINLH